MTCDRTFKAVEHLAVESMRAVACVGPKRAAPLLRPSTQRARRHCKMDTFLAFTTRRPKRVRSRSEGQGGYSTKQVSKFRGAAPAGGNSD